MNRTGVFATEDEAVEIKKLHEEAQQTPVIAFSSAHAMRGGLSGDVWDMLKRRVHEIALAHELPEVSGFYGFDGANNEFVTV